MSAFNWSQTEERYWPRRLLLSEGGRLTSVQRTGVSTYGDHHSPPYNILSYTWGRWEIPEGRALPIDNITWKIPPINPSAFTLEAFLKVIQRVFSGVHFIWIDVACIDQENESTKSSEIGHQAAIFRAAKEAYIWLHVAPREALNEYIIGDHGAELYSDRWLERRLLRLGQIFQDPWFSSTWTLQEAFLRTKAALILNSGDLFRVQDNDMSDRVCRLSDILQACYTNNQALQLEITYCKHILSASRIALVDKMLDTIRNVGALCLHENNALELYATSTTRTSRDKNDRVYGIMQVFGFVLGKSRAPYQDFTLEELEDEFGASINVSSPTIAQMFIHMTDSRPLRNWCIHPGIRIPARVYNISKPVDLCRMSFNTDSKQANFEGFRAPYESWLEFCRPRIANQKAGTEGTYPWVQMDRTRQNLSTFPSIVQTSMRTWQGIPEVIFNSLPQVFGPDLQVLRVGRWEDFEWGKDVTKYAGIICYPVRAGADVNWARLGICMWKLYRVEEELPEHQTLFSPCNLSLG